MSNLAALPKVGDMVEMNEGDIERGLRRKCYHCPIALATMRRYRTSAFVTTGYVELCGLRFVLPPIAMEFIQNFDANKNVHPITFQLGILV